MEYDARKEALGHIKGAMRKRIMEKYKAKSAAAPLAHEDPSEQAAAIHDEDVHKEEAVHDAEGGSGESLEHEAMASHHSKEEYPHESAPHEVSEQDKLEEEREYAHNEGGTSGEHPSMEHARTILEIITPKTTSPARVGSGEFYHHDTNVMHGPSAVPHKPMPHVPNQGKRRL